MIEATWVLFWQICERAGISLHITKSLTYLCGHPASESIWRSSLGVSDTRRRTWRGTLWLGCCITCYYPCSCSLVSWCLYVYLIFIYFYCWCWWFCPEIVRFIGICNRRGFRFLGVKVYMARIFRCLLKVAYLLTQHKLGKSYWWTLVAAYYRDTKTICEKQCAARLNLR